MHCPPITDFVHYCVPRSYVIFGNVYQIQCLNLKGHCLIVTVLFLCNGDNKRHSELVAGGREEDRERTPKRARSLRSEKVSGIKDLDQLGSTKKPIISVVLTAHEAIPGEKDQTSHRCE